MSFGEALAWLTVAIIVIWICREWLNPWEDQ